MAAVTRWFVTYHKCLCTGLYASRDEPQATCPTHPGNHRNGGVDAVTVSEHVPLGMETVEETARREGL